MFRYWHVGRLPNNTYDNPMTDDEPMTLQEVCHGYFHATLTPATLRAEAGRGRLAIFKIGRRHYTTLAAVREMVRLCHVEPKARDCTWTKSAARGLSETARTSFVQAALNDRLIELRNSSRSTSPTSTGRRKVARQG